MSNEEQLIVDYHVKLHQELKPDKIVHVKHFVDGRIVPTKDNFNLPDEYLGTLKSLNKDTGEWKVEIPDVGTTFIYPCYFVENHMKVWEYFLETNTQWELELALKKKK